jgi:hypothetical protein
MDNELVCGPRWEEQDWPALDHRCWYRFEYEVIRVRSAPVQADGAMRTTMPAANSRPTALA